MRRLISLHENMVVAANLIQTFELKYVQRIIDVGHNVNADGMPVNQMMEFVTSALHEVLCQSSMVVTPDKRLFYIVARHHPWYTPDNEALFDAFETEVLEVLYGEIVRTCVIDVDTLPQWKKWNLIAAGQNGRLIYLEYGQDERILQWTQLNKEGLIPPINKIERGLKIPDLGEFLEGV